MGLGLGLFGFGIGFMGWVWVWVLVGFSICALRVLRMDCFPVYVHSGFLEWIVSNICALTGPQNGLLSNMFQLLTYSDLISI